MPEKLGIEVYVRPLDDGAILNFYVPAESRDALIRALQSGGRFVSAMPMNFEMAVLPTWTTLDDDEHLRVSLSAINFITAD